ncbi:MAG TPA: EAL domain-containing protein [Caulobacteraceae bacterium]|nr:EAL domain-containing protein [Caulobacteraceae bacterium]
MSEVLSHLWLHHDFKLVLLAAIVCFCGSVTAFRLYARLRGSRGMVLAAWTLLTGLVAGTGVWSAHILAMLSFDPGVPAGYAPGSTLASLLLAVMFMCAGFTVASGERSRSSQVAGGVLIGLGLAAMHYLGIGGFVVQGKTSWNNGLIALAAVVGVLGSVAALMVAGRSRRVSQQILGGGVLSLAVSGVHFISMAAMSVAPDAAAPPPTLATPMLLLVGASLLAALIIMGGLGAALIEASATSSALKRIRRLADAAYEGIVVIKDGRINDCNAAFSELAGAPLHRLKGRTLAGDLLAFAGGGEAPQSDERREGMLRPLDGALEVPVEVIARLLDDGARRETEGLTVLAVRDLRERRAAEETIRYLAEHDGLTGLANRNALQSRLAGVVERVEASRESLALLCVDIDHFKEANDLHGHNVGDALLVEMSRRLQAALTAPSFAARLGGDEFVVVQVAGGDQPSAAAELAAHLLEVLREPVSVGGQWVQVGASIGIALFPHDGRTGEALMTNADMALFRAKEDGRGHYRFFKREMDETTRERRAMVRELRDAIVSDALTLHYQPIARTADGQICGFEALMRWNHPEKGLVPPIAFIPLAEESGLIAPLGEWALRRACSEAAAWSRPLSVAVNLSPLQLQQPDLPALVGRVLAETKLAPCRLELEVTESALIEEPERAFDNLWALKKLGVRIAMDDFGTGFSSLSTLQSFPFDKIKIDKSFVEDIGGDGRAKVIVRAVLGLGRSLEIPVVAEGVETSEQLEFLRSENCLEVQGYLIGRPVPPTEISGWTGVAPTPIPLAANRNRRRSKG